ncbi:MAG: SDR family oxidoreductase [Chloroflexi bacterium]|nr:SDR family oxidoreductase [Chloroflexota bacterium]
MGIVDGKAGVVTGAGRGIGRGHCLGLAKEGASVIVNDVDGAEAQKVVDEIKAMGGKAVASTADVSSRKGAEELVDLCVKSFGKIDYMVANAGILRDRAFLNMTDDEWLDVLRVHGFGTFLCGQAAARRMREQGTGGAIVNTTSGAHMGNFGQSNYAAAKGAIASLTYTMAIELARYGIRVNAISPSGSTRMSATFKGADGKITQGPFVDPGLNAPVVAFLISDEGNYVTGQVIGTGGERLFLMSQPKYYFGMLKPGGWSVADVRQHFKTVIGNKLENFGLAKQPYAYYGGVKPPQAEKKS